MQAAHCTIDLESALDEGIKQSDIQLQELASLLEMLERILLLSLFLHVIITNKHTWSYNCAWGAIEHGNLSPRCSDPCFISDSIAILRSAVGILHHAGTANDPFLTLALMDTAVCADIRRKCNLSSITVLYHHDIFVLSDAAALPDLAAFRMSKKRAWCEDCSITLNMNITWNYCANHSV